MTVHHFQFEANVVPILEGYIKIAGIEDLSQFLLQGAQNLVLVQARADGLSNLGKQFELFGSPLSVVHYHVVLKRKSDLQRQTNQQPQIGRSEHAPFRMRKQNCPEVVLSRLKANGSDVADIFLR